MSKHIYQCLENCNFEEFFLFFLKRKKTSFLANKVIQLNDNIKFNWLKTKILILAKDLMFNHITRSKFERTIDVYFRIAIYNDNMDKALSLYYSFPRTGSIPAKYRLTHSHEETEILKKTQSEIGIKLSKELGSPNSVERYMYSGLSKEDAENKVNATVEKAVSNSLKNDRKSIIRKNNYSYYLRQGYSFEESKEILSQKYDYYTKCTISLQSYIERNGKENGTRLYNEMIKKRYNTMKKKLENNITTGFSFSSNESFIVLNCLVELLKSLKINYYGLDKKEYFLKTDDNRVYFYDLVIPDYKIIIEYNGSYWHPNNPYENTRFSKNIDLNEAIIKDNLKVDLAKKNGYNLYVIWDNEPNINKVLEGIKNEIIRKYSTALCNS